VSEASWLSKVLPQVKQRSQAVALANVPLFIVCALTAHFAYRNHGPSTVEFFVALAISTILAFLASSESPREVFGNILPGDRSSDPGAQSGWQMPALIESLNPVFPVSLMFAAILLDFWAMGYIITATGGVVTSPYNSIPVTLLVLGVLMTKKGRTWIGIGLGGMAFFVAVNEYSGLFGGLKHPVASHGFSTFAVFLVATGVNLIVSIWIATKTKALEPKET
jgi:uncharacterized membrane protein YecN with MAPEG domain